MPTFRLRTDDGAEQTLQAFRVVAVDDTISFETRAGGRWQSVLEIPSDQVAGIHRRVNELDGRWSWVTERPRAAVDSHVA